MSFLVNAGGELYIPWYECSSGSTHYDYEEAKPLEISVKPNRSALRYLRRLVGNLKDYSDEPTERVNLLCEKESDGLDMNINDLTSSEKFDFFVKYSEYDDPKRFRYLNREVFINDKRLGRQQKVRDLFGNTCCLELTHIGSLGAEYNPRTDYEAVNTWTSQEEERNKKELLKELGEYCKDKTIRLDVLDLSILLVVVSSEYPEPIDECVITETMKDMNYICPCVFDDFDNIETRLEYLVECGLLKETDEGYVPLSEYRKSQFQNALYEKFNDLEYIGEQDIVSAAALLSLDKGPKRLDDILSDLKEYGLEADDIDLSRGLKKLIEEGIVKESNSWLEINPAYRMNDNPDQLKLGFEF